MRAAREIITEPIITTSFSVSRFDEFIVETAFSNRLNYHRILMIKSGSGILTIDEKSFEVKSHAVFLMSKGQVYEFEKPSIISGYVISFGDCFWEKTPKSASNCKAVLFNNTTANQILTLNNSEMSELLFLCNILSNEFLKPKYINQMDVLASYLKIVMIKLANVRITEETLFDSQDYLMYRKFMEILSKEYRNNRSVNSYAEMLNITARKLSTTCKRCSGISAKEIINGQIVAEAKRLLQFSSTTVKEIAYELNFNTPEQFSHFFKKNTKKSPADYRNQFITIST
ncbi:AraC family transcriptional regulator [Flavobacterium sp. NKUCC04_CG]|uniref:helix-turn-helix domain-containing protein n=1 Tax=Flavobacterium sp. NKUCC04_CG TaxID=2842121 RepID=UPI001C5ADDD6|nr:helix-turn-helix domain-containing protein [Flavobacterium sp. NKUCC04_CG]MBW3520308.1 helix-turn-helix domain-containing protein [Flavobacterium sp. NKUCC04_CG]